MGPHNGAAGCTGAGRTWLGDGAAATPATTAAATTAAATTAAATTVAATTAQPEAEPEAETPTTGSGSDGNTGVCCWSAWGGACPGWTGPGGRCGASSISCGDDAA